MVDGASFRFADEIRYITHRAAEHDGRVGTIAVLRLNGEIVDREDHTCRSGSPAKATLNRSI